jgi:hypothetical protein
MFAKKKEKKSQSGNRIQKDGGVRGNIPGRKTSMRRNKKRTITLHVMDCDGIGELEWEL